MKGRIKIQWTPTALTLWGSSKICPELLDQKICHDVEDGFVAKSNVKLDWLSAEGAGEKFQSAL